MLFMTVLDGCDAVCGCRWSHGALASLIQAATPGTWLQTKRRPGVGVGRREVEPGVNTMTKT